MSRSADQAQLEAGGLVPTSAKLGTDDAVDVVVARAYRHAALPGRTVVRLSAESVTTGDDLEMSTLGFGAGEDLGAVAKERKRPLGFPGWALVHDPKNARYALDVVKEFKKHARKAKSKPGHAKEGIDAIAEKLGKTVPHFLPSFFEEAGRAFLAHGAGSFAAAMFGKAREAEAVHALEVDEQHRVDGFLEFALAGAVTTKALTQYAKELGEHHAPDVAYAHFRQLCLQRTLGGMPPWAGMAKDLRRLAKASKLDPAEEDRKLVAEIIESPALAKAAGEFWRAYAEPITELGKASAAARGALLNLFPTGTSYSADLDEAWLDLLRATGADRALVADDAAPEAQPSGGRAAWFDKLCAHLARNWRDTTIGARAFQLLRDMAPMLVADGKPIACFARWRMDLELVELALELGVPVAPKENARFDLDAWAKSASAPGAKVSDPIRTAAHPVLGPMLQAAVAAAIGHDPFDIVSRGKAGFLAAKRAWLEAVLVRAEQGALVGMLEMIALVTKSVKAETFADLPDLHARFAALDVVPALARSLRIGIIDELGWPALEAAAQELDPDGKTEFWAFGGPGCVVLASRVRAIAVDAHRELARFDLVLGPKQHLVAMRYVGGQFLVAFRENYQVQAYWSSAPHDVFDAEGSYWSVPAQAPRAAVLSDGAWMEIPPVLRAGDRRFPSGTSIVAFDGATAWISEWKDSVQRWREVSASGEAGRASWPAFIERGIEGEWKVDGGASYVLPAPGVTASPFGIADGLVGARVLFRGDRQRLSTERKIEMIDGTTWTGSAPVVALLKLPATTAPRPISEEHVWQKGITATLHDETGEIRGSSVGFVERRFSRGQAIPLAPTHWHVFVPRDVAGSQRLRAITEDDARALIAAVPVQPTQPPSVADEIAVSTIEGLLPEITHPRLRTGIAGLAGIAAKLRLDRDWLATDRAPDKVRTTGHASAGYTDEQLRKAVGAWTDRSWSDGRAWGQITRVGEWFASEDRTARYTHDVPQSDFGWLTFAVHRSQLAFLATALGTPAEHRGMVAELFAHLVRSLPPAPFLRRYSTSGKLALGGEGPGMRLRWHGGNAYAVLRTSYRDDLHVVLEYAPTGAFAPLPGFTHTAELRGVTGLDVDAIEPLAAAVAAGRTSWTAEGAAKLAELTGLSSSEATYLLAGCPNANERSANFLDKELREQLGLKSTQAQVARDAMNAISLSTRREIIDEVARHGVEALLDGRLAENLGAAWLRHVGKRVAIPEDLIASADRDLDAPLAPASALALLADPDTAPELTTDGTWAFDMSVDLIRSRNLEPLVGQDKLEDESKVFAASALQSAVIYVPYVLAELPVGHELRAKARRAHARIAERLAHPGLWFEAGEKYFSEEEGKAFANMLDTLGGEALTGLAQDIVARRIPGAIVVATKHRAELKLHPATLDAKARDVVGKLAAQMPMWRYDTYRALDYFHSPQLAALLARVDDTPVPVGGWEQNPQASVPELVATVAKALKLGDAAAALYLQYLVLLWPTPKNLARWNGWKPKQLDAANAELVEKELVLEAKRERAQRGHFLPGGWEALTSPHPPMESWKLALYGTRSPEGTPVAPMGRFLALAPFHTLFEAAWKRVADGDRPRYDEVKR
ncbi:MAG: hypothetical protein SFX73_09610 [Kofleriaceae bacterium]|nr:hypothetical protein [Kofleriaceae bacterium]